MSNPLSNAVTAKIRSMRSKRITSDHYKELSSRKNVSEIASYLLSETRYSESLAGIQPHSIHRGQLENLIREQRYSEYVKLMRYIPENEKEYYRFYLIPAEIEQILRMIRLINDGTPELFTLQYPRYIVPYASIDFNKISQVRDFNGLLEALAGTYYAKRLEPFSPNKGEQIDYTKCDTALFTQYYELMYDIIKNNYKGQARRDLNKTFGVAVQLRNTVLIYRIKKFFPTMSDVDKLLIPMRNRTARREINSLVNTPDAEAFVAEIKRSQFGKDFSSIDFDYIEYRESFINYKLMRKMLYRSEVPAVCFTAYMALSTIEVNNLVKIIESVYYNLKREEASKLLVYEE